MEGFYEVLEFDYNAYLTANTTVLKNYNQCGLAIEEHSINDDIVAKKIEDTTTSQIKYYLKS